MISFVIPAKNEEKNIENCLKSIIESCGNGIYEIIVVDNGSVDKTKELLESYDCKVIDKPSASVSKLRNIGASIAAYDLVAFIDADVQISNEWYDIVCKVFKDKQDIVCLGGYIDLPINPTWVEKTWHLKQEYGDDYGYVKWVSSMNMVLKKKCFIDVGGFNEELYTCEDVNLCNKLRRAGNIFYTKEMRCVHLGEAKTLKHFFYKEKWRGIGNFKSFIFDPSFSSIPGTALPYINLLIIVLFLFFLLFHTVVSFIIILFFFVYPIAKAIKISCNLNSFKYFHKLFIVWSLYCFSRSMSIFASTQRKEIK